MIIDLLQAVGNFALLPLSAAQDIAQQVLVGEPKGDSNTKRRLLQFGQCVDNAWEKPKQVLGKDEWKKISADSAPPGVYTPNMSEDDMTRWKGKITGVRTGHLQAELRKTFCGTGCYAQVLVIVSLKGGIKYKNLDPNKNKEYKVYISMNGGAIMSMEELDEMREVIGEAYLELVAVQAELDEKSGRASAKGDVI